MERTEVIILQRMSSTPEFNKVFISVKSTTGANLTTSQKHNYK